MEWTLSWLTWLSAGGEKTATSNPLRRNEQVGATRKSSRATKWVFVEQHETVKRPRGPGALHMLGDAGPRKQSKTALGSCARRWHQDLERQRPY